MLVLGGDRYRGCVNAHDTKRRDCTLSQDHSQLAHRSHSLVSSPPTKSQWLPQLFLALTSQLLLALRYVQASASATDVVIFVVGFVSECMALRSVGSVYRVQLRRSARVLSAPVAARKASVRASRNNRLVVEAAKKSVGDLGNPSA